MMAGKRVILPRAAFVVAALCWTLSAMGAQQAGAGDPDWFRQSPRLLARFETIRTGAMAPDQKQAAYLELLNAVAKAVRDDAAVPPESPAGSAFSAWMSVRVWRELGDRIRMEQAATEYDTRRKLLSEENALAFRYLFDKLDAPHSIGESVCEVQTKGNGIRVTAVNVPLGELVARMAQVTGERISVPEEAAGSLIRYTSADWHRVDGLLVQMLLSRGLVLRGQVGEEMAVVVWDSSYSMSVGEHMQVAPRLGEVAPVKDGIPAGFVIWQGYYIRAPYEVSLVQTEEDVVLKLNGLVLAQSSLKEREIPPVKLPPDGQFPADAIMDLGRYAAQQYAQWTLESGKDAAKKKVEEVLKGQKALKGFSFEPVEQLILILPNGQPHHILLQEFVKAASETDDARKARRAAQAQNKIKAMTERKQSIENTLRDGGVVIIPRIGMLESYSKEVGLKKLTDVCHAIEDALACQQEISDALFDPLNERNYNYSWNVFLNLRQRELLRDIRAQAR